MGGVKTAHTKTKGEITMKKKKPTFWEFLKNIYGITLVQFYDLSKNEQFAAELDYKIRYGSPIRWE